MSTILLQSVLPFFLSAIIVIVITLIAERYGTKLGGILGTLPSTIVVAYVFLGLTEGTSFAAESASIVPAEMGINLVLLGLIALLTPKLRYWGVILSVGVWALLTILLVIVNISDIVVSLVIYVSAFVGILFVLNRFTGVRSQDRIKVHYTLIKIVFRGFLAGVIIALAVSLSYLGPVFSGIFSIFPAIFLSTMLIFLYEHGPVFTGGMAKSMIYGSQSVNMYAVGVFLFYPVFGIVVGSVCSYAVALVVTSILLFFRRYIT